MFQNMTRAELEKYAAERWTWKFKRSIDTNEIRAAMETQHASEQVKEPEPARKKPGRKPKER